MKHLSFLLVISLSLICNLFAIQEVKRYAIIAGVNNGGENRQILKYAFYDASAFSNVMFEMGGFTSKNTIILKEPSIKSFDSSLHAINFLIDTNKQDIRTEVLIYYSGHADENGLLFGNHCYEYQILRNKIDSIKSDVKITILDACASGSITRMKGGVKKKAFLVDASSNLTGYAFITSSSENEASQESDNIKGSFFTHFLVSGLRGAADASNDGKVTLSEAYQFAFHETLAETESTVNGPQHPSYDMRLTGSGDIVMTDIRKMNAFIKFPSEISGRIFIRDSKDQLISEMVKQPGKTVEIGIPIGTITIELNSTDGPHEGEFDVKHDTTIVVRPENLKKTAYQKTPAVKGPDSLDKNFHYVIGGISTTDALVLKGLSVSLFRSSARDTVMGIQYSLFSNNAEKPLIGLQRSLFGKNYCKSSVIGIQKAFLSNITDADFHGSQLALFFNGAQSEGRGAQVTAFVNNCEGLFSGIQLGMISVARNDFNGVSVNVFNSICLKQANGVQIGNVNYARTLRGVQISPSVNIAYSGGVMGVQLAGLSNISNGKMDGVQCASLYNQSKDVNGIQIGLVNKADTVKGVQAGLINISKDMYGYPIGLFNYSRCGVFSLNIWFDEQMLTHLTFKSGTRNFFNSFTAAFDYRGTKAGGFGMGFRIPFKYTVFESDIHHLFTFHHLISDLETYDITEKACITIGTRFIPLVSIFGGFSGNMLFNFDRKQNTPPVSLGKRYFKRIDQGIYSWPGFHFGITLGRF
jgi:hypothetical protein